MCVCVGCSNWGLRLLAKIFLLSAPELHARMAVRKERGGLRLPRRAKNEERPSNSAETSSELETDFKISMKDSRSLEAARRCKLC